MFGIVADEGYFLGGTTKDEGSKLIEGINTDEKSSYYTFAHLNRRFIYRHLGIAEMLNITKEVYQ